MNQLVLSVRALTVCYGAKRALTNLELCVASGEWFSLLGPNGSGKTTLLRCVSGQLIPTTGTVHIGGHSIIAEPEKAKRLLGFAHPPEQLPGLLTGNQCLEIYAAAHRLAEIGTGTIQLAEKLRLHPALDQAVSTYSLGMRQKLSVLLALIGNPSLVVLDEAFNGLDPASALILKEELHERTGSGSCAVVLASHGLDTVLRHSTRAALLSEGTLVRMWDRGAIEAMRNQPEAFEMALAEASLGHI